MSVPSAVNPSEELAAVRRGLKTEPGSEKLWRKYLSVLENMPRVDITPQLANELAFCLARPALATPPVKYFAIRTFLAIPTVRRLSLSPDGRRLPSFDTLIANETMRRAFAELSHPLVLHLLLVDRIVDRDMELFLAALRRHLLESFAAGELEDKLWPRALDFLCALAAQCFLNEYVYLQTPAEAESAAALFEAVEHGAATAKGPRPELAALAGAYRPLHELRGAEALRRESAAGVPLWAHLLTLQIDQPAAERQLRASIPELTPIRDRVSRKVRQQYEENPYPRWTHVSTRPPLNANDWVADSLSADRSTIPPLPKAPDILVAGCGTGREPIEIALALPGSRITAVDLSLASLSYAARKARDLKIGNMNFAQADILELAGLGRQFDMIVCSGVLHHMDSPADGLRSLVACMKPGAVIQIALYSRRARDFVAAARDVFAEGALPDDADGIRDARFRLLHLPKGHLGRAVTEWRDFYTLSTCRDLLFHVQEHCYTPTGIAELLQEAGLEFLGFRNIEGGVLESYRQRFPDDPFARDLALCEAFEVDHPRTFVGMYHFMAARR